MKKSSVFIICFLLLVIIALTCFVIYYTKITNEKLDALTANNVEKNETKNEVVEEDDKEKYAGLTVDEWKDAVRKVMTKKLNYEPDEIDVRIENDEMQIGIGKGYSVDYDFKVDIYDLGLSMLCLMSKTNPISQNENRKININPQLMYENYNKYLKIL